MSKQLIAQFVYKKYIMSSQNVLKKRTSHKKNIMIKHAFQNVLQ